MTSRKVEAKDGGEAGSGASIDGDEELSDDSIPRPNPVTYSQTSEGGVWNLRQANYEFKVHIESQRTSHELKQDADDQAARRFRERWTFIVVISVLVALLIFGLAVGTFADDDSTRTWAQGLVTALVGVIGGALAGYAVGKSGR